MAWASATIAPRQAAWWYSELLFKLETCHLSILWILLYYHDDNPAPANLNWSEMSCTDRNFKAWIKSDCLESVREISATLSCCNLNTDIQCASVDIATLLVRASPYAWAHDGHACRSSHLSSGRKHPHLSRCTLHQTCCITLLCNTFPAPMTCDVSLKHLTEKFKWSTSMDNSAQCR